jgi:hypothetical protein
VLTTASRLLRRDWPFCRATKCLAAPGYDRRDKESPSVSAPSSIRTLRSGLLAIGQERTIDPKVRIVGNRVSMDQPVGAIRRLWAAIFEWKYAYECRHIQLGLSSTPGRNRWFSPSLGRVERVKKRAPYAIVRTTPPSTRKEVPVVADACSEQT